MWPWLQPCPSSPSLLPRLPSGGHFFQTGASGLTFPLGLPAAVNIRTVLSTPGTAALEMGQHCCRVSMGLDSRLDSDQAANAIHGQVLSEGRLGPRALRVQSRRALLRSPSARTIVIRLCQSYVWMLL